MSANDKPLYYLDELPDYKVASDDCDVRGWEVKDKDSRIIGKVDGLLVNKAAERVVYLDVKLDRNLSAENRQTGLASPERGMYEFKHKDGDDHLIIPVGMVKLDEEAKAICASQIDYNTFAKARRFPKGAVIERNDEITLLRHYLPTASVDYPSNISNDFYNGREFENTLGRSKV